MPGGRTPDNERLFTQGMGLREKTEAFAYHILDSFVPGAVGQAVNIADSLRDVPNKHTGKYRYTPAELAATFLGVRFTEVDPENVLRYAVSDRTYDDLNAIRTQVDFLESRDSVVESYERRQGVRYRNAQELDKKIRASIELIGIDQTAKHLKKHGMGGDTLGQFLNGRFMPESISTDTILKILEKTPLKKAETATEVVKDLIKKYAGND